MSRMKVNLRLLPVKGHFFLYFGGVASLWPFVNVFAKQLGISAKGVAFIFGAAPIAGLFAKPFFGALGDRFKKKKLIFLFFICLNLISYGCIAFLTQNKPERPVYTKCTPFGSYIVQCGGSNAHCNATVLDSFNLAKGNRSQSLSNNVLSSHQSQQFAENLIERCDVRCEIYSFDEGRDFCLRVLSQNRPPICNGLGTSAQPEATAPERKTNNNNFSSQSDNSKDKDSSSNGGSRQSIVYKPTVLEFSANIKMWEVSFEESEDNLNDQCLHMPIETISYKGFNQTLAFACGIHSELSYCFADCPNNPHLNAHLERVVEEYDMYDSLNFWLYGTLVIFAFVAMAVVTSIGDALCFQTLGDKPQAYGIQRQFGALGWGSISLLSGFLIDFHSGENLFKEYKPAFYLAFALLILDLVIAWKWDIKEIEKPKSLRRNISDVLTDLRIIVFIGACIIVGMCTGLQWNFLMWYAEDLAAAGESCDHHNQHVKTLQGLISALQCFAEIPFFYISGYFIKKLGHVHCITLVLAVFGVRFVIYSLITNPWAILPVEILQGLTFGVFYSAMANYADKVSPPGTHATVQGIFGGAFEGLGVAAGSLVGGLFFHSYGGYVAFRVFGCGAIVFSFLHCCIMLVLNRETSYRGVPLGVRQPDAQEMRQITASNLDVDSE